MVLPCEVAPCCTRFCSSLTRSSHDSVDFGHRRHQILLRRMLGRPQRRLQQRLRRRSDRRPPGRLPVASPFTSSHDSVACGYVWHRSVQGRRMQRLLGGE